MQLYYAIAVYAQEFENGGIDGLWEDGESRLVEMMLKKGTVGGATEQKGESGSQPHMSKL